MSASQRPTAHSRSVARRVVAGLLAGSVAVAIGVVGASPAVADATTGSIQGFVTAPDGSVPDGNTIVTAYSQGFNDAVVIDPTTGAFEFDNLVPGAWRVEVQYQGTHEYLPYLWGDGSWFFQSDAVNDTPVAAGAPTHLSLRLIAGATIGGHLTGANGSLANATIQLLSTVSGNPTGATGTFDVASQTWTATDVGPGSYSAYFTTTTGSYAGEYWDQKGAKLAATPLVVAEGASVSGLNVTLQAGATIQGSVFDDHDGSLQPHSGGYLHAYLDGGSIPVQVSLPLGSIDSSGHYSITGLYPGTWRVCQPPDSLSALSICSSPVTVGAGGTGVATDLVLPLAGIMSTFVYSSPPGGPEGPAQGQVLVYWWNAATSTWVSEGNPFIGGGGYNNFANLPPGDYKVQFFSGRLDVDSQWWDGQRYEADATIIHLASGGDVALPLVVLPARDYDVLRTDGEDRFSGAVAMTQEIWPLPTDTPDDGGVPLGGVPIIYIANGLNYPDALSAGPAAIVQQGALLLVWPTSIPDSVAAELHRLRPQKIVIVGGPASVSDAVETQLGAYSDHVTRQNGIDRFEASRNLAKSVWGDPDRPGGPVAPTVFISTGLNFPDALDAGPAAGLIDAPVILVNGSLSTLDPDTAVLLDDLGTKDVFIAGGPGSVSPGIEVALIAKMGGAEHVRRFTGETRYEAAAAINQWFFPQAETVFLATGANFPDALAGAPLAGVYGGPIYLSQPGCIPQVVSNQITAGGTQAIWLLGGPGSISPDVYNLKLCAN